jgi:hypothetical protein
MLRKLLPDYPEDVIRRSFHYQYRRPIDVYSVTTYEVELLNRINSHHSRWAYSRQLFTKLDEIVRVSDFLPYYEHLRQGFKSASDLSALRQLLPQPQQTAQRSSDFMSSMPTILRGQSTIPQGTSVQTSSHPPSTDFPRADISSTSRPIPPAPNVLGPPRLQKSVGNPYTVGLPQRPTQYPSSQQRQSTSCLTTNTTSFISTGK